MFEIEGKYTSAKIFAEREDDDGVLEQTLAICNHPIFQNCSVRIMPDCHRGKGCTIGFTSNMPANGEIIPNIIGVDQNCGMLAIKLDDKDIINDYEKLDKVIKRHIPVGRNGRKGVSPQVPEELFEQVKKYSKDTLKENYIGHLQRIGSLGDGNHFISLEKGKTGTYLIIHTGSRNIGNQLAIHFQKLAIEKNCYGEGILKELSYIEGKDAEQYLECAKFCREYATCNRDIIANEILIGMRWREVGRIETIHNYIGEDNIIRKGAISCYKDEKVLIPLNMVRDRNFFAVAENSPDPKKPSIKNTENPESLILFETY